MATVTLTKDNFASTIENNDVVLIDFWAPWCGPCKSFGPIFEEASEKYESVVFGKVNTDEQSELAAQFQVRSIPTIVLMREQIVLMAQPGMLSAGQLDEVISKAQELDMEEVRQAVKEQQESPSQDAG